MDGFNLLSESAIYSNKQWTNPGIARHKTTAQIIEIC
jgi:hypothetical protein